MDDHYDYTAQDTKLQHRKLVLSNLLQSKQAKFIYGPILKHSLMKEQELDEEEKFNTLSKQLFNRVKERLFRKASVVHEEEQLIDFVNPPTWVNNLQSSSQYKPFHQFVYKNNIIIAVNNINSQGYSIFVYKIEKTQNTTQYSQIKKIENRFEQTPSQIVNTFHAHSGSCSLFITIIFCYFLLPISQVLYLVYEKSRYKLKSFCVDSTMEEREWVVSDKRITFADIRSQYNVVCVTYAEQFSDREFERICYDKSSEKKVIAGPLIPNSLLSTEELVSLLDMGNNRVFALKMRFADKDPFHYDNINIPIQSYVYEYDKENTEWHSRPAKAIYNTAKHLLLKSLHKHLDEFVLQNRPLASISPNNDLIVVSTPFHILVVYSVTKEFTLERNVFDYSSLAEKKKSDFIPPSDYDRYDADSLYHAISTHLEKQVHEAELPITFLNSNKYIAIQYSKTLYVAVYEGKQTKIVGVLELPNVYSNYVKDGALHLTEVTPVEWEKKLSIIGASFSEDDSLVVGFEDGTVMEVFLQGLVAQKPVNHNLYNEETTSTFSSTLEYLSAKWKLIFVIALVVALFVNNELNIRRRVRLYQQQQNQQQQQQQQQQQ